MRLPALVVLSIACLAAAQAPAPLPGQPPRDVVRRTEPVGTARIKGRVVASDTGNPMRGATVTLTVAPPTTRTAATGASGQVNGPGAIGRGGAVQTNPTISRRATTNSDGAFEFNALPAGSYRLFALPGQYAAQYVPITYGATRTPDRYWADPGQSIDLTDGQSFDKAVMALPRGGVIVGRVTDDNADPLARVEVYTLSFPPGSSRGQRTVAGSTTDDLGQYRLFGLMSGEYAVVADARANTFAPPNAAPETEEERIGFIPTYYPGTPDEGSAQRIRVKAGTETPGIEIRVGQARLFHISGSVIDSQGRPVAGANGQLTRRGPTSGGSMGFFAYTDPKGQFQMRNIPPGEYRLTFRPPGGNTPVFNRPQRDPVEIATMPVMVAGDVENLLMTTGPGVSITGQIVFEQGAPPTGVNTMRVFAVNMSPDDGAGVPTPEAATIAADSTFTLKGLIGEYGLRTAIPNQYVKTVTVNGEDVTDVAHEFKQNDRVTITMTSRTATLEGDLTNPSGVASSEVGVIVFSDAKSSWRFNSVRTRRTGVDAKGHYRVGGLLAGRYYIAALPRERFDMTGGYIDAAFFEQLSKEATEVVVGEGEERKVDLRLLEVTRR